MVNIKNFWPLHNDHRTDSLPPWCVFGMICSYLVLVRLLRYRRCSSVQARSKEENVPLSSMSITTAQQIFKALADVEFPFMFMKSVQFALFRTYGIPTISKLLVKTSLLACPASSPQRYTDTEVLFIEFAMREWGSQPWLEGVSRVKCIHAGYRRAGQVTNSDMLYTIAALVLQPVRWIERWEWRVLTDTEKCAIGVLWKGIADALDVNCEGMYGYDTGEGWRDGLVWLQELSEWMEDYESTYMIPDDNSFLLAEQTTALFMWSLPRHFKPTGKQVLTVLMDDRLRRAMKYDQPSPQITRAVHTLLVLRRFILRHLVLPRPSFLGLQRTSANKSENRTYMVDYFAAPYYVKPTIFNRWGPAAWISWLSGLPLPGDDGGKYGPQGYKIVELGPNLGRSAQAVTEAEVKAKTSSNTALFTPRKQPERV